MSSKGTLVFVLLCALVFSVQSDKILDFKVITAVRHGLEQALDFIEINLHRSMVDVALGVAFARGFLKDSYKNGHHVMDQSTLQLLKRCSDILAKARYFFGQKKELGSDWKFNNLIGSDIWTKPIDYKSHALLQIDRDSSVYMQNKKFDRENYSDDCIYEIINATTVQQKEYRQCPVSAGCWNTFYKNAYGSGYFLTHKLLILQIAKARKCIINAYFYDTHVAKMCTFIYHNALYETGLDDRRIDLFMEQILLCGYEGFTDFIRNDWLFKILKAQRTNGCFKDNLPHLNKTRIKRDAVRFEDGCNDHTTTLGAAVLGLYYNYLVNQETPDEM